MTEFDFIADHVRTFNGPSDSTVTLHFTEGATGCDDDQVICMEFILQDGCFHIGSQAVPRHLGEGVDRTQKITIAARETANFEATLLAKAFETAAEWLREFARNFEREPECFQVKDGPASHQPIIQELLNLPSHMFRGNELGFLRSLADRPYALTEKQQQWLDAIIGRIVGD